MASILVGTNDFRAGLASVLIHACTSDKLPSLCRVRIDIGPENVTITATDRFTAGLSIVSVVAHLNTSDREETDLPWVEVIDLHVDDAKQILSVLKGGKDVGDEPEFLLRIDSTPEHVTITDSSGLIDGRALTLPRFDSDDAFPVIEQLIAKIHSGHPALLENVAFAGVYLARFKVASTSYKEPVHVEATTTSRGLLIRCGESFLGAIMPIPRDKDADEKIAAWRDAWTRRLPAPTSQETTA
ncbi:hypothetical protein [Rhodococcus sp. NPDC003348]